MRTVRYYLSSLFLSWGVALIPDDFPRFVMNRALREATNTMTMAKGIEDGEME